MFFQIRFCCEHAGLSKAAAATSADAAAAAFTRGGNKRKQARKGGRSNLAAAAAEEEEEDGLSARLGIDIQAPCVQEIVLLQVCVCVVCEREASWIIHTPHRYA
jgi:hypothetical protein